MFTLFFPFIIFMKLISHGGVLGNDRFLFLSSDVKCALEH